jgi:hypothetical protein
MDLMRATNGFVSIDGDFGVLLRETEQLDHLLRSFYRRYVVERRVSPPAKESVLRYFRALQNERYRMLIDRVGLGILPVTVEGGRHGD